MREWEVTGWSFKLVFTGTNEHGHHSMVACMLWTMASTFSPPEEEQLSGGFFFHFTLWCLRTWTKMGNIKMEMKEHLGQAKSQWQSHKRKKYQSWQMQQGREDGYPFLPTPLPKLKKKTGSEISLTTSFPVLWTVHTEVNRAPTLPKKLFLLSITKSYKTTLTFLL